MEKIENGQILWVDSDPNISRSGNLLKQRYKVKFFNETLDCYNYIKQTDNNTILCLITSMMERGGRKERGLWNALEMVNQIRREWTPSYSFYLVMITTSADEQECKDAGFDLVVYYNRTKMEKLLVERLKERSSVYYKKLFRDPTLAPCQELRENARKFLDTLDLEYSDMDPFVDRCFCKNCEPKEIWYRGEPKEKYVLPIGWYRYGIKLRDEYIHNKDKVFNWHVAYHGTKIENVSSIVKERRIMFPGDILKSGKRLAIAHNNCFAKNFNGPVIYVSPSIKYASHDVYAKPEQFNGRLVKVVIQCKIKPGSYKKFRETLCFGNQTIDSNFKNEQIEWVTDNKTAVVPYGLLIGFF